MNNKYFDIAGCPCCTFLSPLSNEVNAPSGKCLIGNGVDSDKFLGNIFAPNCPNTFGVESGNKGITVG